MKVEYPISGGGVGHLFEGDLKQQRREFDEEIWPSWIRENESSPKEEQRPGGDDQNSRGFVITTKIPQLKEPDWVTVEVENGYLKVDRSRFTPEQEAYYQASQYMSQQDWPNAARAFKKVLELNPGPKLRQGVTIMAGTAYIQMGELEKAARMFEEAIRLDEDNDFAHLFLGAALMLASHYEEAIGPLRKSFVLNPHNSHVNFYLGYVYEELGQFKEAIRSYNAEIESHSEATEAHERLAKLYKRLGDENPDKREEYYLKAIETYKKWSQIDLRNSAVLNLLGYLYTQVEDPAGAMEAFAKAIKIKPDNLIALSNLGVAYLNAERSREAKEVFERLISFSEDVVREQLAQTSPDNLDKAVCLSMAESYQLLGAANLKLYQSQAQAGGGEAPDRSLLAEAEAAFKTALEYNPEDVHSLYNLALVYYMLGLRAAASTLLKRVLELAPEFPDAADILHTIEGELEQWRGWLTMIVGRFAESSSEENPVHTEELVEKLAEGRAKLYEGVGPAREGEAFTEEDLLKAMLPVGEWLSNVGADMVRFEFAARIYQRGWLSSENAAKLGGLDLRQYINEAGQIDVDRAIKVFKRALDIDPENEHVRTALEALVEEKLKQRLVEKGLLKQIKEPITDFTPYQNRTPIVVHGKPVSETILEDRR